MQVAPVFNLGCFPVDLFQKAQPLDMGVTLFGPAQNLALQVAQGRK